MERLTACQHQKSAEESGTQYPDHQDSPALPRNMVRKVGSRRRTDNTVIPPTEGKGRVNGCRWRLEIVEKRLSGLLIDESDGNTPIRRCKRSDKIRHAQDDQNN